MGLVKPNRPILSAIRCICSLGWVRVFLGFARNCASGTCSTLVAAITSSLKELYLKQIQSNRNRRNTRKTYQCLTRGSRIPDLIKAVRIVSIEMLVGKDSKEYLSSPALKRQIS